MDYYYNYYKINRIIHRVNLVVVGLSQSVVLSERRLRKSFNTYFTSLDTVFKVAELTGKNVFVFKWGQAKLRTQKVEET